MRIPVSILGATGTVGQKIVACLQDHPKFQVDELMASEKNWNRPFSEAVNWRETSALPAEFRDIKILPPHKLTAPFAISALPSDVARLVEPQLAARGIHVISNASAMRMEADVPLLIPEINKDHLSLLSKQKTEGKIVTNPNCSTVFVALALSPLMNLGTISSVDVVTLQALSGAGYPGVSSNDIVGNIIPNIQGEEEKIEAETRKILGTPDTIAPFPVFAHVHRVPVLHGHTVTLHVHFQQEIDLREIKTAFLRVNETYPHLYKIHEQWNRPQPLRDVKKYDQRVHIGRIKQGSDRRTIGLISMGHNLMRGAAGAALLNLEAAFPLLKN